MREEIKLLENYGNLKAGRWYRVYARMYDYYILKHHGKNICVPAIFIEE
jgi:hypothetical protein